MMNRHLLAVTVALSVGTAQAAETTTADLARLSAYVYSYSEGRCDPDATERACPPVPYGFEEVAPGKDAAVFRNRDTKELVVAFTGTRLGVKLDLVQDAGILVSMVDYVAELLGLGRRGPDLDQPDRQATKAIDERVSEAQAFVEAVEKDHGTPAILTGHSLGGFVAQVVAARLGNRAETFNAPGALGYLRKGTLPTKRPQVVNHVRLYDVVGTKGCHVGKLTQAYESDRGPPGITYDVFYNHGIVGFAAGIEGRRASYNQPVEWKDRPSPDETVTPLKATLDTFCNATCRLTTRDLPEHLLRPPCPGEDS